jgi:hypothetical protein
MGLNTQMSPPPQGPNGILCPNGPKPAVRASASRADLVIAEAVEGCGKAGWGSTGMSKRALWGEKEPK